MLDELRRAALITSGVAELTRARAEQVVKDLVKAGDVRKDQASSVVKELLKRSEQNRKELTRFIRSEIQNQVASLGFANKRDLERLERRITRLEEKAKASSTSSAGTRSSAPKKKPATAKTSARTTQKSPDDGSGTVSKG